MIIAADVGTTFQLGPYVVRIALRKDNPAFAKYLIFRGDDLVGHNFSRPSLSDCQWLERWGTSYAEESSFSPIEQTRGVYKPKRRPGRPRKEVTERELQEALEAS